MATITRDNRIPIEASATDLIFMPLGAVISGYVLLFVDSIFVLPFILVLQSEMYINRFDMLKG